MGWVRVGEKLRDDGRLGEDLAVVGQGRNKAARVDLEVLGGTRGAEVDDLLLERDAKFGQSDVGTMSPWVSRVAWSGRLPKARWRTKCRCQGRGMSVLTWASVVGIKLDRCSLGRHDGGAVLFVASHWILTRAMVVVSCAASVAYT